MFLKFKTNSTAIRRFRRDRMAMICIGLLMFMVFMIVVWPWLASVNPDAVSDDQYRAPGLDHLFGTDVHGRDILARTLYGARISLLVGIVGTSVSLVIGVTWGAVAGYLGGRWDGFMMRLVDVLYSLPSIIFVIALVATMEGSLRAMLKPGSWMNGGMIRLLLLFVGLGAVSWLTMARIVRGQVLSLRNRSFVEASRAMGASHTRILFRHILPNVAGIIMVYITLTIPSVILSESFLSYLGLGIQPPQASLGSLIAEGAAQINPIRMNWWLLACPSLVLVVLLLCLNFVGEGLKNSMDHKGPK